jgi:hypothetical protein
MLLVVVGIVSVTSAVNLQLALRLDHLGTSTAVLCMVSVSTCQCTASHEQYFYRHDTSNT